MIGLEVAAMVLLAAAGFSKLRRPGAVRSALTAARLPGARRWSPRRVNRLAGLLELLVAVVAFVVGGRLAGLVLLVVFAVLAGMSARMVSVERGQDCGCFSRPTPVTHGHTAVNLAAATVGLIALIRPSDSLLQHVASAPFTSAAVLAAAGLLAYLGYLTMTALPELLATVADLEAMS